MLPVFVVLQLSVSIPSIPSEPIEPSDGRGSGRIEEVQQRTTYEPPNRGGPDTTQGSGTR